MKPKISVRRKRDNVYLKLMGNFSTHSSGELLHALKKLVLASLEFSHPDSDVSFIFKTHAKVSLGKERDADGSAFLGPLRSGTPNNPNPGRCATGTK